jgi:hypothetical protein
MLAASVPDATGFCAGDATCLYAGPAYREADAGTMLRVVLEAVTGNSMSGSPVAVFVTLWENPEPDADKERRK